MLVERHSRYLILCKMDDGTAEAALEGFTRQMKKMPAFMRKSLTYDRGSEMACFRQLSERLNIDIWFCDPTPHGSGAATKTPMVCCASSCPRAWIFQPSARPA